MAAPEISVIIAARDAAATLPETFAGLSRQRFDRTFEVILVDDGSRDNTALIAEAAEVVDRVARVEADGPARARNAGSAAASSQRFAFLDADCKPDEDWLMAGCSALDSADLVLGDTRPRPDRSLSPFARTLWVTGCSPLFESANMFVRRELFERLGGFESWLRPRRGKELGEDVLFGWQAVRAGARITHCPEALVHHEVFPRGPVAFAAERWRLRFFPAMTRRIPELRDAAYYRRYFLTSRSARFDLALLGLLTARLTGHAVPALAAAPYAALLAHDVRRTPGPAVAAAGAAADVVGLAALLVGSARSRTPLL